jgi:hypothetical protein
MAGNCRGEGHPLTLGWVFFRVLPVQAVLLNVAQHRWRHELADLLSCGQAGPDYGRRDTAIFVREG